MSTPNSDAELLQSLRSLMLQPQPATHVVSYIRSIEPLIPAMQDKTAQQDVLYCLDVWDHRWQLSDLSYYLTLPQTLRTYFNQLEFLLSGGPTKEMIETPSVWSESVSIGWLGKLLKKLRAIGAHLVPRPHKETFHQIYAREMLNKVKEVRNNWEEALQSRKMNPYHPEDIVNTLTAFSQHMSQALSLEKGLHKRVEEQLGKLWCRRRDSNSHSISTTGF